MDEVVVVVVFTLNIRTKCVDWPFCVSIFFICMIASKMDHSALRSRLLVAAGGSVRFGCQHSAHSKQGAPFQSRRRR